MPKTSPNARPSSSLPRILCNACRLPGSLNNPLLNARVGFAHDRCDR